MSLDNMKEKRQRNPVAKELIVNQKFKHKMEKSYKERLHNQKEIELEQEKKDYLNGETEI